MKQSQVPASVDLMIAHGYVTTMDRERRVYSDGGVAIRGNRIVAVGPTDSILAQYTAPHVIRADGMLVLPGLIDGHNHPSSYLQAGSSDDLEIRTSVFQRLYPYEMHLRPDEAHVAALGTFVEMLKSGTTFFNDPGGYDVDAVGEAARIVGIRGILSRSLRDIADKNTPSPRKLVEPVDVCLREGEDAIRRWHGADNGKIRAWFSLRNVVGVSDELCAQVKQLADKYCVGIHTHVAASKGANEITLSQFGKRALERYYDLGLFGPRLYCAHVGFANEREVDLLKEHDVKVAHCPTASMLGAMGVLANGMIPLMVQRGVTVSLGSDTAASSGFLDLIRTMYVAACVHKDIHFDAQLIGAYKALEMATIDGARACLWEDELGSIEPQKLADIILIDRSDIEWKHAGRDPVRSLVYCASGASVDTVIVDGRVIMRRRVLLTVDEEETKQRVLNAGRAVLERTGYQAESPWPQM